MDSLTRSGDIAPGNKRSEIDGMASVADFKQAVGSVFTVAIGGRAVSLELTAVHQIASSPRPGGGFTLLFKGPRDMPIGLQIFARRHDDRKLFAGARWAYRQLS